MDEMCMCFFFQAEDGIRGSPVTGVQTCALPIFAADVADAFGYLHFGAGISFGRQWLQVLGRSCNDETSDIQ